MDGYKIVYISIHALLAESDTSHDQATKAHRISIHALLAESDRRNSTERPVESHFYPRSPCGERLKICLSNHLVKPPFLSTLSLRRATREATQSGPGRSSISIHALLAESDGTKKFKMPVPAYFYPRSPCGERPSIPALGRGLSLFLSTLSLRRATIVYALILADAMLFLSTLSLRRATGRWMAASPNI